MNKAAAKIFSEIVLSEKKIKIKLLGDSITHGVGGEGFNQNGEPIVKGFARNPDGYCWANQFRNYMEENFNCKVVNNACTGTNIEFVIEHFDTLVDADDDIILCTIGTNNRHQYHHENPQHTKEEHMRIFYDNIVKLHGMFKEANKKVVFVANIPASRGNENDGTDFRRIFHMCDVHNMYTKASFECGFPLISMYKRFSEYCEDKGITVDSLLVDGLHPSNAGYDVMFKLLMDEIGIAQSI